ncbi:MAG: type II secretion system F family protein [Acidimicrobiia bacterium]|nr:type II secretion system F family protein [Acidimicrobiia bacterium]
MSWPAVSPGRLLTAAIVVTALGIGLGSPLLVAGPLLAVGLGSHWRAAHRRQLARRRMAAELPAFVDRLIQQLKAGGSLAQAVRTTIGPAGVEGPLQLLRGGLDAGLGLGAALRWQKQATSGAYRDQAPELALLLNTLTVLVDRGGPALPSLERLNDTLRSADAIDAEIRVQAGQATASAVVLAGLPVLFVIALIVVERRLRSFYLFEPGGAVCVAVAGTLSYAGWWWMQRIVESGP